MVNGRERKLWESERKIWVIFCAKKERENLKIMGKVSVKRIMEIFLR